MGSRVYLDWNASAPPRAQALRVMSRALELGGNPSSVHSEGRAARRCIDEACDDVAALAAAGADDVVFTSGATEANAMVMAGGWDSIVLCGIEHESVRAAAVASSAHILRVATDDTGQVLVDQVAKTLRDSTRPLGRVLVTVQAANNETGILQDVAPVFAYAHQLGFTTHCDAVQIFGRLPFDCRTAGADLVSVSAHKIGGPQGIGALVVREGVALRPLIVGGGQQRNRRAGTENVAAIAGFGAAAAAAARSTGGDLAHRIATLRGRLEEHIASTTPDAVIIGRGRPRLPNTTCVALPGRSAETVVIGFDLAGIAIGAGSACSSGKVASSAVLSCMGLPPEVIRGAVRFSLGDTTTAADIGRACDVWTEISQSASRRSRSSNIMSRATASAARGD